MFVLRPMDTGQFDKFLYANFTTRTVGLTETKTSLGVRWRADVIKGCHVIFPLAADKISK